MDMEKRKKDFPDARSEKIGKKMRKGFAIPSNAGIVWDHRQGKRQ